MGGAYYNENDPQAAAWLRELIKAGHIAPGDVDGRSIVDVRPGDLHGYTQCHFFAGIGVWSSALRQAGWHDDRPIWTGSCPCQPFSGAGQRKGTADERHLWPTWFRLIQECGPATVIGEQVASKDALQWLDLVFDDLEGAGYAAAAVDTCAAGACVDFSVSEEGRATLEWIHGAVLSCPDPYLADELRDFAAWAGTEIGYGPAHIRQRLYWMAYSEHSRRKRRGSSKAGGRAAFPAVERLCDVGTVADNAGAGFFPSALARIHRGEESAGPRDAKLERRGSIGTVAIAHEGQRRRIADGKGCERDREATGRQQSNGVTQSGSTVGVLANPMPAGRAEGRPIAGDGSVASSGATIVLADADGRDASAEGLQRGRQQRQQPQDGGAVSRCNSGVAQGDTDDARSQGRRERGDMAGKIPTRTLGVVGSDWIVCTDGKARPTQPGILPLAHDWSGPSRVACLRAAGNAINKAQAVQFIEAAKEAIEEIGPR